MIILLFAFAGNAPAPKASNSATTKNDYIRKGMDYAANNEYEKAIDAFKKAYELDPRDSYASDQIAHIYRNNLHDERNAEYWKSKSDNVTNSAVDSNRGASAKAYAEKAERKRQRQEAQNRR